jgi:hypothetical protein
MPKYHIGYGLSDGLNGDTMSSEFREFEEALRDPVGDASTLGSLDRDQLARDVDEIERATAALRRGEPALESWTADPPVIALRKPRPVWLLIGLLWLSTALVTVGAVAAIAKLVG